MGNFGTSGDENWGSALGEISCRCPFYWDRGCCLGLCEIEMASKDDKTTAEAAKPRPLDLFSFQFSPFCRFFFLSLFVFLRSGQKADMQVSSFLVWCQRLHRAINILAFCLTASLPCQDISLCAFFFGLVLPPCFLKAERLEPIGNKQQAISTPDPSQRSRRQAEANERRGLEARKSIRYAVPTPLIVHLLSLGKLLRGCTIQLGINARN